MDFRIQNYPLKLYLKLLLIALLLIFLISFVIAYRVKVSRIREQYLNYDEDDENYVDYFGELTPKYNVEYLIYVKEEIGRINENQLVYNENLFGGVKSSTFVIVIQVYANAFLLQELLESLKYVVGISGAYLIFSHDNYNEEMNDMISNISFAKWTQIFYPHSTQLHPKGFPGPDKKYCIKNYVCYESVLRNHERAQKKHFWWWQTKFVFENMPVLSKYNNYILFLEEGEYILQDLVFMMKILGEMMPQFCPQCEILTFGTRDPDISQFDLVDGNVVIEPWNSSVYTSGLAFNRSTWNNIRKNRDRYCYFDDYRWDASLRFLGSNRSEGQFVLFSSEAPRVLRIREHSTNNDRLTVDDAINFATSIKRGLFPRSIVVKDDYGTNETVVGEGDWGDVRDQELCMYLLLYNTTQ